MLLLGFIFIIHEQSENAINKQGFESQDLSYDFKDYIKVYLS